MQSNILSPLLSEITEKYKQGLSIKQISQIYKCNVKTVLNLFKLHGVSLRTLSERNRKYPINDHFLKSINSEETAYFLGLMYADGYNDTKRGRCSVSLVEKDVHILNQLRDIIQPTKPLQLEKHGKWQNTYRLEIYSRIFIDRLEELGCVNNKTFKLTFPTEQQVPKEFQRHFIRGYFDGDGHINNGKRRHFSMVGTEEFILGVQEVLARELDFNITKTTKRFPERNNNIDTLLKCGRIQCVKFGKWLYKDATLYLKRKYDIFTTYKGFND